MTQKPEDLDFSGLFKLDVLINLDISSYSFYEVGLKKFLAVSSDKELVFFYINSEFERFDKNHYWDFLDNPIYCMCFEPSGTWVVIISDQKVLLVPFLPLFIPQNTFDCKWSLSSVTVLPLHNVVKPTVVVWWLTKESDNILIIGSKNGTISFFSLESQSVVGESKVSDEVSDLQICFDDSLDLLTLLITGAKAQQWKLVLEHRSFSYNWLQQVRSSDRRDSFMSYIKHLSKDKITLFTQTTSKESNKPQTVEYVLKPVEYLPSFRKRSNNWSLTAQYVNGRHFLTAFELNEGTLIIESPDQDIPARTLRPVIKQEGEYAQALWSQRLIYLLRRNELEVHSTAFSIIQGVVPTRDTTLLWNKEIPGSIQFAYLMSTRDPPSLNGGWKTPTFLCDLQMPRFNMEPCLVISTAGAFLMRTSCEPSEWVVGMIARGSAGAEVRAAALGAAVPGLLRAAADLQLSRGKLAPAHCLYSLSQCPAEGWVARLGVFGRLHELSLFKFPPGDAACLPNAALAAKLLAMLAKVANNCEEKFDMETKFSSLTPKELEELSSISVALGLWELVPMFNIHRGHPSLLLNAMRYRSELCRGAIDCLLRQRSVVAMLLVENVQWFYDFIVENCNKFDTKLLKCLCIWLSPLQDQFRPVIRDMKQGITTNYTKKMSQLIATFVHVTSAIESRDPNREIILELPKTSETWKHKFTPSRTISCGLSHWAVCDEGNAKIVGARTEVNTELIGRVVSVACGRHHTLILTENGVYASGDNTYGQLGVGSCWMSGLGEQATAHGALSRLDPPWRTPIRQVAAGHYHSAAVDMGGRLYMWGWGVHGQLGLGTIDDEWSPKVVTKLQGRNIISIGLGACHSVVLTASGEVFAFGASVFGQLGGGARDKSSVPVRVPLAEHIRDIAVGYFHNLALSEAGTLYAWGSSPQNVRAAHHRRAAAATSTADDHLAPTALDLAYVRGRVSKIAAGWHHSAILTNTGTLYTWGLNFDGQLGTGDRKQVPNPSEPKFNRNIPTENLTDDNTKSGNPDECQVDEESKALVACGGDFTVLVDDEGKIYVAGNTHVEGSKDEKTTNRVIMMKTTKRLIKIPTMSNNSKFVFQPIDRIDIMFPFDTNDLNRTDIEPTNNPVNTLADFKRKSWSDEILLSLLPWIKEDSLVNNRNLAAKFAYHTKMYAECLRLFLEDLQTPKREDVLYLAHTECSNERDSKGLSKKDEAKITIFNIMSKRIKDISLSILNEEQYPEIDTNVYKSIPCCCDELNYLSKGPSTPIEVEKESNLSMKAADIVDKCVGMFPIEADLWETCFRQAKEYFLDNGLSVSDLELVLRKYMEMDAQKMASAIMYSNDCVQNSKILSPKLYLNMCSHIMDAWT